MVLSVLLLALCACGKTGSNASNDDTLCQFKNLKITKYQHVIAADTAGQADDPLADYYVSSTLRAFWPEVINGKPCDALQQALLAQMTDTTVAGLEGVVDRALVRLVDDSTARVQPVDALPADAERISRDNVTVRLMNNNDRLFTFEVAGDSYMAGGAHGMYTRRFVTYDVTEGKVLNFNDIIADTTMLKSLILQSLKDNPDVEVANLFLPADGQPPVPTEYYIDQQNVLHLYYQVYDIAPYAMGPIDAAIYPIALGDDQLKVFTPLGKALLMSDEQ